MTDSCSYITYNEKDVRIGNVASPSSSPATDLGILKCSRPIIVVVCEFDGMLMKIHVIIILNNDAKF